MSMNVEEVSSVAVDTAFHLHRDLGPGLLESVYEAALVRMLEEHGWNVKCLLPLTLMACTSTRDFASSRLRVSMKVGGTRRREGGLAMSGGDNKQITQGNIQKPGDPELVADIRREIAHGVRLLELCPTPPGEGRTRQETLINLRPQIHEEWRRDPTESSKSVPKKANRHTISSKTYPSKARRERRKNTSGEVIRRRRPS